MERSLKLYILIDIACMRGKKWEFFTSTLQSDLPKKVNLIGWRRPFSLSQLAKKNPYSESVIHFSPEFKLSHKIPDPLCSPQPWRDSRRQTSLWSTPPPPLMESVSGEGSHPPSHWFCTSQNFDLFSRETAPSKIKLTYWTIMLWKNTSLFSSVEIEFVSSQCRIPERQI